MSNLECPGLDGRNPLHFLASLGLLRLGDRIEPGFRLGWYRVGGEVHPIIGPVHDQEVWLNVVLRGLKELGRKKDEEARTEPKGIAHFGERIGEDPLKVRRHFQEALQDWWNARNISRSGQEISTDDPWLRIAQFPALCCDRVAEDGRVKPTPYSFSNGSSGKYLMKDFRRITSLLTLERLRGTLFGGKERFAQNTAGATLCWDPSEMRLYATSWKNPEYMEQNPDIGANALAYLGLSMLPAIPVRRGITAVAIEERSFRWPIWSPMLTLDVVGGLLARAERYNREQLRKAGIMEIRKSEIVNPNNKRNYFGISTVEQNVDMGHLFVD